MSEANKGSIRDWDRGHPCDILVENLDSFCLCTGKNLNEVGFKVNRLIFAGEVQKKTKEHSG